MSDPHERLHQQELKTEKEARRLKVRTQVLMVLFCGVLVAFFGVLYDLQVVHGADYREQTAEQVRTVSSTKTVDSVRGQIMDRYGRVLATNEISYHVELDTSAMGDRRNEIVAALLALCKEEGVEWAEALPISKSAPWSYTSDTPLCYETEQDGETVVRPTNLGSLAVQCKWVKDATQDEPTAEELLTAMCETFRLIEKGEAPTAAHREIAGVLYAVYLRLYQLVYTDYVFADDIDITFISKAKERGLDGVLFEVDTTRRYLTDYAAHVLGTVGDITPETKDYYQELGYPLDAKVGRSGVEQAFESYLYGTSGTLRTVSDEEGHVISQEWVVEPDPGDNVVLTLDMALQTTTEDLLSKFASGLKESTGAAAVVVDMSGGVLAMASYPEFGESQFNRATQGTYAPGSTFKMITAVAGLTEGIISPRETIQCTGKYLFYPDPNSQPKCWIYPGNHASETVTEAITDSCNIFFFDVGRRLGIRKLAEYATKFGLGQKTGVEINEAQGYIAGPETSERLGGQWYEGSTMYASIGQENNQVTPLQLANYVATLVNGGNHYQAHLLKEIRSSDNSQVVMEYQPVLLDTIDIDPTHLAAVKQGMYDLSKTASMAPYFGSLPVEVGCKTGTAEVQQSTANAVFVCFAPYDDPQVAVCLVAEKGASGGSLAQVAAGILRQYFSAGSELDSVSGENVLVR